MRDYQLTAAWHKLLTPDIVALLTQIHEFMGEQNLFIDANEDMLRHIGGFSLIQYEFNMKRNCNFLENMT